MTLSLDGLVSGLNTTELIKAMIQLRAAHPDVAVPLRAVPIRSRTEQPTPASTSKHVRVHA